MPQVYLIGGPNGAGKTTSAFSLLRNELSGIEFVNADLIAAGLNLTLPEAAAFQAGRLMLERLDQLVVSGNDFIFESTLATRSFAPFLMRCQQAGYIVNLIYFWLESAELALMRVAGRVRSGGHNVPPEDVRRRYDRSVANLLGLYIPLADRWIVYNNSSDSPRQIAQYQVGEPVYITDKVTWQLITGGHNA